MAVITQTSSQSEIWFSEKSTERIFCYVPKMNDLTFLYVDIKMMTKRECEMMQNSFKDISRNMWY